ncbi:MAG: hypothetical protein JSR19_12915 [Proteobacteria bacterium]|nr:hypothetical protein [Pseudomonadota bacterium]HQR03116.1 NAD(P)-dependent oxidoreductase [Rhodocyclaceae bacterium]
MKLLSHIDLPGLKETLSHDAPGVELVIIPSQGPLPSDLDGEILLTYIAHPTNVDQVIAQCPSLRWIHAFGTGVDGFPLHLIGDRLLTVGRGATAVPIAEWIMAMMLAAVKHLPESWHQAATGPWQSADLQTLAGQTLAIAGFGTIGQALAQRAHAFGMTIRALTRTRHESGTAGVIFAAHWNDLVHDADHVVLALPLTNTTRNMVDSAALAAMKPGAHLINIARGPIVDQDALRLALDSGHLALASLDTVTPEPLPQGHWLYDHPQIRLSPHISWSGPGMNKGMVQLFIGNLQRYLKQEALEGRVDLASGY